MHSPQLIWINGVNIHYWITFISMVAPTGAKQNKIYKANISSQHNGIKPQHNGINLFNLCIHYVCIHAYITVTCN